MAEYSHRWHAYMGAVPGGKYRTNQVLYHLVSGQQWLKSVMVAWMATKERGLLYLSPKNRQGFPLRGRVTLLLGLGGCGN